MRTFIVAAIMVCTVVLGDTVNIRQKRQAGYGGYGAAAYDPAAAQAQYAYGGAAVDPALQASAYGNPAYGNAAYQANPAYGGAAAAGNPAYGAYGAVAADPAMYNAYGYAAGP